MTSNARTLRVLVVSADRTFTSQHPLNLGDALLTEALADELNAEGLDVRIADFGPRRLGAPTRHVRVGGVRGLLRAIRSVDAVIIGGGTLVQDDAKSGPPWRGLPRLLLVTVSAARIMGKKVALFGVGSNPVRRRIPKLLLRLSLTGTRVWVRDTLSANLLKDQWGKATAVAADTALLSRRRNTPVTTTDQALLVAAYAAEIALLTPEYLDRLRAQFGAVDFISMHQGNGADADAIPDGLRPHFRTIHRDLTLDEAVDVVGAAQGVLSSRMHALYLALLLGKPSATLSDRPKVQSFRTEFGLLVADPTNPPALPSPVVELHIADPDAVATATARIKRAIADLVQYLNGGSTANLASSADDRIASPVDRQATDQ